MFFQGRCHSELHSDESGRRMFEEELEEGIGGITSSEPPGTHSVCTGPTTYPFFRHACRALNLFVKGAVHTEFGTLLDQEQSGSETSLQKEKARKLHHIAVRNFARASKDFLGRYTLVHTSPAAPVKYFTGGAGHLEELCPTSRAARGIWKS